MYKPHLKKFNNGKIIKISGTKNGERNYGLHCRAGFASKSIGRVASLDTHAQQQI